NLPGYPTCNILLREGVFTAASEGITIHLDGKTAHAAYPETGLSPALALAQLLTGFEGMKNPVPDTSEFHLVTVIYARLGTPAFGTAPGDAIIAATLRTFSNQGIDSLKSRLLSLANEVAGRHGLVAGVSFNDPFRATLSDPAMVMAASEAAKASGCKVVMMQEPFRWSEDFGQFTERWPGVFAGLGAGMNHAALHTPDYDFPDELIPIGMTFWENLVSQILK
ncbi:MAG: amidohydrolase, partial [Bacteroidetes bacterium HGW-Bacteroidetes-22]